MVKLVVSSMKLLLICQLIGGIFSSEIPVLLWTSKRIEYLVSLSGHTLTQDEFSNGYLDLISEDKGQNVAVFLQGELSLEDITVYGDVYNDASEGAVFSNVRSIFETYQSTHLPSVKEPARALEVFKKKFDGKIHVVEAEDDIDEIPMEKDMANLIVVSLPRSNGADKKSYLQKNDAIIGSVTRRLSAERRPFTAIYTAHRASQPRDEVESNYRGRRLLADADPAAEGNTTYSLFKIKDCVLFYFTEMTFGVVVKEGQPVDNAVFTLPLFNESTDSIIKDPKCDNNSAQFTLDFSGSLTGGNLTKFSMAMNMSAYRGYWLITHWTLDYEATIDKSGKVSGSNISMDTYQDTIYGTMPRINPGSRGYSYYCGNQPAIKQYERSPESNGGKTQVQLTFKNMQLQYMARNFTFGPANHCASFFTGAAWASIIVMLLMTMILAFGVMMIMNITTMDRFDDPKGKTIQVNVSE